MLSFVNSKLSAAKLAEWSPSDWPESLSEMRVIVRILLDFNTFFHEFFYFKNVIFFSHFYFSDNRQSTQMFYLLRIF